MTISEKLLRAKADYDAVYEAGKQLGIEQGRKVEYDAFWDGYQDNGNRTHYSNAFSGLGWAKTFKPKYNMTPIYATDMFNQNGMQADLVSHLESLGVTLDLSHASNADKVFYNAYFTRIGVVDLTGAGRMSQTCAYCAHLVTIDKIIVTENCTYSNPFLNCPKLVNVTFEGVIGQNGLNFQWSTKLSKASITSIINRLSTTTSGLVVTLSKTAVNNAFETGEGLADGSTSEEWNTLIGTRSNWIVNLAEGS